MKEKVIVMGFDNTLVKSEDLFIEAYEEVFDIKIDREYWFSHIHNAKSAEEEFKIIEDTYNVKFTPEIMQKCGEIVVPKMLACAPKPELQKLLETETCYILTGSPAQIVKMYLKAWNISLPDEYLLCNHYNGSGEKEKILAKLQEKYDVIYYDDDQTLVSSAKEIVSYAFKVSI